MNIRLKTPTLSVLKNRNFRLLWSSSAISMTAEMSELLVLGWLVLQLTGSAWQVALVGLSRTATTFSFSLIAGALGDRLDRRNVVMAAQAGSVVITIGVLGILTLGVIEPWHLFIAAGLRGACRSFDHTCRRALIFDVVGPKHVLQAVSLDHIGFSSGKIVGPLLIGILLEITGTAVSAYVVLTILHLLSLTGISLVSPSLILSRYPRRRPVLKSITEGLVYAYTTPSIAGVLVTSVVMNVMFQYHLFIPVMAQEYLHVGPALMGVLASADGIGTIIGALILSLSSNKIRHHGRIFMMGSIGTVTFLLFFAISPWYFLSFLLLVCLGMCQVGFSTMQSSILLMESPEEVHSRVFGAQQLAVGTGQLGSLHIGAMATIIGLPITLAITAAIGLVSLGAISVIMPALLASTQHTKREHSAYLPNSSNVPSNQADDNKEPGC